MKKGLIATIAAIVGGAAGSAVTCNFLSKKVKQEEKNVDKFKGYYNVLNKWLSLKQEGKSPEEYFLNNGYKKIAIYGMGELGNRLYDELKNSGVEVKYAIDKNIADTYSGLKVLDLEDRLEEVDVIVVTAIFAFDEIEETLHSKVDFPIISLEDVVWEA